MMNRISTSPVIIIGSLTAIYIFSKNLQNYKYITGLECYINIYLVPPFKISVTSILKQKDLAIEKKKFGFRNHPY
jgi:hypothetical protein